MQLIDDVEKCKSHACMTKKQIMLKYADMVVCDLYAMLSSLQRYVQYVSPCLLQRMAFSAPRPY
jgi:hypothetical protein